MTTHNKDNLKKLLAEHKPETVCLAGWLERLGISRDLQKYYRRSGWLESVGTGAFKRPNDRIEWEGGLYTLQTQAELPIHAGALTALIMQGHAHYARLEKDETHLFAPLNTKLPAWFRNYKWEETVHYIQTSFLPESLGCVDFGYRLFVIKIAGPERAILESLYMAPDNADLMECYQIMEGLNNLRPKLLQQLLEQCSSIKVKRLFLFMADKAGHAWLKRLDFSKIDLGSGSRAIVKNGVYVAKYGISVPKELAGI